MATEFTNHTVDVSCLPRLEAEQFVPLDPNFLKSKLVADALTAAVIVAIAAVITVAFVGTDLPIGIPAAVAAVLLVLVVVAAVLQTVSVRHLGYLAREHDLSFRRGVISRQSHTIPYNRVQDVGIDRGPVERLFGLATLRIRSAGGTIGVEGLGVAEAEKLKKLVVSRAGGSAYDEEPALGGVTMPAFDPAGENRYR